MPEEDGAKKFAEAMARLQNELEQVPTEGRNFRIEVSEKEDACSIVLTADDGRIFDLAVFLPEKFRFAAEEGFHCNWTRKVVIFSKALVPMRGFLLSLFHEIGHARAEPPKTRPLDWPDKTRLWWGALKKLARKPYKIFQKTSKADLSILPWWFVDRFFHVDQAKLERAAWAFSLNQLRRLKREGLDVFCGFRNMRQVIIYVDYQLLTYEISRFCKKLETESEKALEGYRGIFYKKFSLWTN